MEPRGVDPLGFLAYMGFAEVLYQGVDDADIGFGEAGDIDGGGLRNVQKIIRGYAEYSGQLHDVLRGRDGDAHLPSVDAGAGDAKLASQL